MKVGVIIAAIFALFALATAGLWGTVGGLVDQAGAREARLVSLDVRFSLTDSAAAPLPDAPVRLVFGANPEQQPASSGQSFTTDARGTYAFTTKAPLDKSQKKRPTNFVDSLFAKPELTDHVSVGAELGYMTYRWLYVANVYRFPDGTVVHNGVALYTRDDQGRFSRPAEQDGRGGWKIADLGTMRLTTIGHDLTRVSLDRTAEDHWALSLSVARQPPPVVR